MNKVKLISTDTHTYNHRSLKPGDPFEADEEQAKSLIRRRVAKRATEEPESGRYRRRDLRAAK